MPLFEIKAVLTVEAPNSLAAEATVRDRLSDVVKHDEVWAEVIRTQDQDAASLVIGYHLEYSVS